MLAVQLGLEFGRASRRELAKRYDLPSVNAVSKAASRVKQSAKLSSARQEVLSVLR